jgi:hypothetical protein
MGTCEVCGNRYDKAFSVQMPDGGAHIFDSFECAIERLAPRCAHCKCRIIGHGVEGKERDSATGKMFCCEHCAHA